MLLHTHTNTHTHTHMNDTNCDDSLNDRYMRTGKGHLNLFLIVLKAVFHLPFSSFPFTCYNCAYVFCHVVRDSTG